MKKPPLRTFVAACPEPMSFSPLVGLVVLAVLVAVIVKLTNTDHEAKEGR
jgi:hypothetical protein